ncbi:MAG: phosphoglucosamine mutase [Pseudomonadota bacterium]
MKREFFGTDGIRGRANTYPMTAEIAQRLGAAAGRFFRQDKKEHRVVIGKDTRRSSYMFENALTAGFLSTGMDVLLLGPVPTPAVGMLTRSMRADVGVMISASHNAHTDNGIKFFGPDGFKLSDKAELEIEALIRDGVELSEAENIGYAKRIDDGLGRYVEFAKTAFSAKTLLNGLKIVVDCANGAAYKSAPTILWELGAQVIPLGVEPNGFNINKLVGSTHPDAAAARVIASGADLGICLDGDADRVILIDEKGRIVDGDQIMGRIAMLWQASGRLAKDTLVATVMSNMGLEKTLSGVGIDLVRTGVGDRYVVEEMRAKGYNLGGEQSGHIVMTDFVTTGDGLIAALQFISAMVETGQRASELAQVFDPFPQILENVRYKDGDPLSAKSVQDAIYGAEKRLVGKGRLLIRKSGTEPLIRVMAECEDEALLKDIVGEVSSAVEAAV